jgi:hypothetical protein
MSCHTFWHAAASFKTKDIITASKAGSLRQDGEKDI